MPVEGVVRLDPPWIEGPVPVVWSGWIAASPVAAKTTAWSNEAALVPGQVTVIVVPSGVVATLCFEQTPITAPAVGPLAPWAESTW
jgi:hypothetical protein